MILSAIAAATLLMQAPTRTVNLVRGDVVEGFNGPFKYWDSTDTYLDQKSPENGNGGQGLLLGGPGRTVLVRFGDLARVVGPGWRVTEATMELNVSNGKARSLKSIGALRQDWGEGPMNTLASVLAGKGESVRASRGQACWKFARFGDSTSAWNGATDFEPIKVDTGKTNESQLVIDGLATAIQTFAERPYDNHGFALTFTDSVEFVSNQSGEFRPRLRLRLEPTEKPKGADLSVVSIVRSNDEYRATVKNLGDGDAPAFKASWLITGDAPVAVDGPALAKGAAADISIRKSVRSQSNDHRWQTVDFRLAPGTDTNPRNDACRYYVGGIDETLTYFGNSLPENELGTNAVWDYFKSLVSRFNDVACAHSRYSFAPEGARERVNFCGVKVQSGHVPNDEVSTLTEIGVAAGLKNLALAVPDHFTNDPFAGIMGGGDTRNELVLSPRVTFANTPKFPLDEVYGLLSRTDVATLNAKLDGIKVPEPNVVLIRVLDRGNEELANLNLDFFDPSDLNKPVQTVRVDRSSSFVLPAKLKRGDYLVRASLFGATDWVTLREWQLADLGVRGNIGAALLELHFNLPTTPLEIGDVAKDRGVSDSVNSDPSTLSKLTTEGNATDVKMPAEDKGWVEIDLKKDRTFGEIVLETATQPMWNRFEIRVYGTGDKLAESFLWTTDANWGWTTKGTGKMAYRGPIIRARYIRIINRGGGEGFLSRVRVTPVKSGAGG